MSKSKKLPVIAKQIQTGSETLRAIVSRETVDASITALLFQRGENLQNNELQVLRLERLALACLEEPNFGFSERFAVPLFVFATKYSGWMLEQKKNKTQHCMEVVNHDLDARVSNAICKLKVAIATHMPDLVRVSVEPESVDWNLKYPPFICHRR